MEKTKNMIVVVTLDNQITKASESIISNLYELWDTLSVLRGLQESSKLGVIDSSHKEIGAKYFYRYAFTMVYILFGRIFDFSNDVYSIYVYLECLKENNSNKDEILELLNNFEGEIENGKIFLEKIKKWRNKVIAHSTRNSGDKDFYTKQKVNLDEIETFLNSFTEVYCNIEICSTKVTIPKVGLSKDTIECIKKLFGYTINHEK